VLEGSFVIILGENGTNGIVRGIGLEHGRLREVVMREEGCCGEGVFECIKRGLCELILAKRNILKQEKAERVC
jgi:hypothetical protein